MFWIVRAFPENAGEVLDRLLDAFPGATSPAARSNEAPLPLPPEDGASAAFTARVTPGDYRRAAYPPS